MRDEGIDEDDEPSEPDELEDLAELDPEDIEGDLDDDIAPEDLVAEDLVLADDDDAVIPPDDDEEDEAVDLEEELHPDDVEEPLDVLLLERTASTAIDEDEDEIEDEEEDAEVDDRAEGSSRILPRRPGEFVCRSCFLVKHPSQLADAKKQLCRDCV